MYPCSEQKFRFELQCDIQFYDIHYITIMDNTNNFCLTMVFNIKKYSFVSRNILHVVIHMKHYDPLNDNFIILEMLGYNHLHASSNFN